MLETHIVEPDLDRGEPQDQEQDLSKQEKSLQTLASIFLEALFSNSAMTLDINQLSREKDIPKRRMYDITNVLEGIKYIKKLSKNNIQWLGVNDEYDGPMAEHPFPTAQTKTGPEKEKQKTKEALGKPREKPDSSDNTKNHSHNVALRPVRLDIPPQFADYAYEQINSIAEHEDAIQILEALLHDLNHANDCAQQVSSEIFSYEHQFTALPPHKRPLYHKEERRRFQKIRNFGYSELDTRHDLLFVTRADLALAQSISGPTANINSNINPTSESASSGTLLIAAPSCSDFSLQYRDGLIPDRLEVGFKSPFAASLEEVVSATSTAASIDAGYTRPADGPCLWAAKGDIEISHLRPLAGEVENLTHFLRTAEEHIWQDPMQAPYLENANNSIESKHKHENSLKEKTIQTSQDTTRKRTVNLSMYARNTPYTPSKATIKVFSSTDKERYEIEEEFKDDNDADIHANIDESNNIDAVEEANEDAEQDTMSWTRTTEENEGEVSEGDVESDSKEKEEACVDIDDKSRKKENLMEDVVDIENDTNNAGVLKDTVKCTTNVKPMGTKTTNSSVRSRGRVTLQADETLPQHSIFHGTLDDFWTLTPPDTRENSEAGPDEFLQLLYDKKRKPHRKLPFYNQNAWRRIVSSDAEVMFDFTPTTAVERAVEARALRLQAYHEREQEARSLPHTDSHDHIHTHIFRNLDEKQQVRIATSSQSQVPRCLVEDLAEEETLSQNCVEKPHVSASFTSPQDEYRHLLAQSYWTSLEEAFIEYQEKDPNANNELNVTETEGIVSSEISVISPQFGIILDTSSTQKSHQHQQNSNISKYPPSLGTIVDKAQDELHFSSSLSSSLLIDSQSHAPSRSRTQSQPPSLQGSPQYSLSSQPPDFNPLLPSETVQNSGLHSHPHHFIHKTGQSNSTLLSPYPAQYGAAYPVYPSQMDTFSLTGWGEDMMGRTLSSPGGPFNSSLVHPANNNSRFDMPGYGYHLNVTPFSGNTPLSHHPGESDRRGSYSRLGSLPGSESKHTLHRAPASAVSGPIPFPLGDPNQDDPLRIEGMGFNDHSFLSSSLVPGEPYFSSPNHKGSRFARENNYPDGFPALQSYLPDL